MLEKIKAMFSTKEKKVENLIFLLILLIITLIVINSILKEEKKPEENSDEKHSGAELAEAEDVSSSLEKRIETILSKIVGVGKVSVLLTYAEDELEGTVIVSEGANDISVKENIISAVEAVTGLGKHRIQVYEMKN